MRVRTFAGIKTLLGLGPQIDKAGVARPEGLLHFENNIIFRLFPLHIGMPGDLKEFHSQWGGGFWGGPAPRGRSPSRSTPRPYARGRGGKRCCVLNVIMP